MSILAIHDFSIDSSDGYCTVQALVEDAVLLYQATRFDPAEYGPALCEATVPMPDDTPVFKDENDLIKYLEHLQPEWSLVDLD